MVHVAVRSWTSTSDNSSIDDVLPRKMLSRSGLGILAHGIGFLGLGLIATSSLHKKK